MLMLLEINKYKKADIMPNVTYTKIMHDISGGKIKSYKNMKYGDLYDVWTRIQK